MVIEDLAMFNWVITSRSFKGTYKQPINVIVKKESELYVKDQKIKIDGIKKFCIGIRPVTHTTGTGDRYEIQKNALIYIVKRKCQDLGMEFNDVFDIKETPEGASYSLTTEYSKDEWEDRLSCLTMDNFNPDIFTIFFIDGEPITGETKDLTGVCKVMSDGYEVYESLSWGNVDYLFQRTTREDYQRGVIENMLKG